MTSTTTLPGPLTAFTPPSSCFNEIWWNSNTRVVLGNPYHDADCKPPGWNTKAIYSPAFCPSGYRSVKKKTSVTGSVTETILDCCPSSFNGDKGDYSCISYLPKSSTIVPITYSSGGTTISTAIANLDVLVNAHSIEVRYQSTDRALLFSTSIDTASTSTASSTAAPATSPTSVSTATSTSTTSTNSVSGLATGAIAASTTETNSSSGLATGAIAGIGAGVAIAIILAIALIWWVYRTRRRKQPSTDSFPPVETKHVNYTHAAEFGDYHPRAELDALQPWQSHVNHRPSELASQHEKPASELPGSGR